LSAVLPRRFATFATDGVVAEVDRRNAASPRRLALRRPKAAT